EYNLVGTAQQGTQSKALMAVDQKSLRTPDNQRITAAFGQQQFFKASVLARRSRHQVAEQWPYVEAWVDARCGADFALSRRRGANLGELRPTAKGCRIVQESVGALRLLHAGRLALVSARSQETLRGQAGCCKAADHLHQRMQWVPVAAPNREQQAILELFRHE